MAKDIYFMLGIVCIVPASILLFYNICWIAGRAFYSGKFSAIERFVQRGGSREDVY